MKTNMASSYTSSPRYVNDTDFDDVDSLDLDDDRDFDENFTDEGKCTEKKLICTFIKSVVCIGAKHAASTVTCLPCVYLFTSFMIIKNVNRNCVTKLSSLFRTIHV